MKPVSSKCSSKRPSLIPPYTDPVIRDGKPAKAPEIDWRDPRNPLHQAYKKQQTKTSDLPEDAQRERALHERFDQ